MGIKLLQAGIGDFVILEKAPSLGGTWWYNRYPGAACDVPSHLYSFSFEVNRDWTNPYASAPEILAYMQHCADKYGVTAHVRLNTEVREAAWDEYASQWRVRAVNGSEYRGQVLIAAQGMFNEPSWPEIPGLRSFAGPLFHTARWDHTVQIAGARVGVIGSAASAVQCVPEIAKTAAQLTLFQRTPNWILPKGDTPYSPSKLAYLKFAPDAVEQRRARLWQEFDGFALVTDPARRAEAVAQGLANIALVEDPTVRRKLTPDYSFGCKRVLLSSNYYPTFNRDNVELVTETVACITPLGVTTADDVARRLDVLILATGFHVTRYLASLNVIGRDQCRLNDAWHDGAQAYLGIATARFPNLFQLYGPNTNKGTILFMIECQVAYILRQLARMQDERLAWMDVRPNVMAAYNEGIQRDANAIDVWAEACNNYFRDPRSGRVVTQYPRPMTRYRQDTLTPDLEAYEVG